MATFDLGQVVGKGISSISLLSTSGKTKTYRITFSDNTYFDFNVTDGNDGSNATVTIADNLTTDSSSQVLSAKQGKKLNDDKLDSSAITSVPILVTYTDNTSETINFAKYV